MKKYLFGFVIISIMLGCSNENKQYAPERNQAQSIAAVDSTVSDSSVVPKIIKTADVRFRVKDVQQTKENLSRQIKSDGGTVVEFETESLVQETEKVRYDLDSLKEITSYRKEGSLIAKIPSEKLDDFLNTVARMAVFVEHQAMKMDDQSMAYLANRLKAQNRAEALKTINKTAKRKGNNVETSLYLKDEYVDQKIANMNIDDKVKFSTLSLSFYQDNTISTLIVGNDKLSDYGPGFFKKLVLSILAGWSLVKEFILVLTTLWPLLAIGLGVFLAIRFMMKKKKAIIG